MKRGARKPSVAFQGEHGAFSEDAACEMLGTSIDLRPLSSFQSVFEAVESGEVDSGVVPIENSLGGSINQTYDLLLKHSLIIGAEHGLRVRHCLMALPGTKLKSIRRLYSHPQALAQCERYLGKHPAWEVHALYDTAGSARLIAKDGLADAAAIACARAAQVYGLALLAEGIEDSTKNYTRFIQIGRKAAPRSSRSRTSIVFGVKDSPGALYKSLCVFALRDINLKKIESRPSKKAPWEYVFYLDFEGHAEDEPCRRALGHLEEIAHFVKLLGSYPLSC